MPLPVPSVAESTLPKYRDFAGDWTHIDNGDDVAMSDGQYIQVCEIDENGYVVGTGFAQYTQA